MDFNQFENQFNSMVLIVEENSFFPRKIVQIFGFVCNLYSYFVKWLIVSYYMHFLIFWFKKKCVSLR